MRTDAPEISDWESSSNVGAPLPGQTEPQILDQSVPEGEAPSSSPAAAVPSAPASATSETPSADAGEDLKDDETPEEQADRTRDKRGRFARHRAESQKASAADVPRIRELTAKWRTAETQLTQLQQELAQIRAERAKLSEPPPAPAAFSEAEPTSEQFQQEADPYTAYVRALAKYDLKKEAYEAKQREHTESTTALEQKKDALAEQQERALHAHYAAREQSFKAQTPDFEAVVHAGPQEDLTPVLKAALLLDDNGPRLVYSLAKSPELYAEMLFLSDGKPLTEQNVAILRRILNARVPAVPTRSAAASNPTVVHPPPNLVRTGPIKPASSIPDDDADLVDHERAFPVRQGRRR
jgi:hypothetical protein